MEKMERPDEDGACRRMAVVLLMRNAMVFPARRQFLSDIS
jgi:hypothetical protein